MNSRCRGRELQRRIRRFQRNASVFRPKSIGLVKKKGGVGGARRKIVSISRGASIEIKKKIGVSEATPASIPLHTLTVVHDEKAEDKGTQGSVCCLRHLGGEDGRPDAEKDEHEEEDDHGGGHGCKVYLCLEGKEGEASRDHGSGHHCFDHYVWAVRGCYHPHQQALTQGEGS